MPQLFLSYRRAESRADAKHLRDRLRDQLPHFQVIRDLDDIPPGTRFLEFIRDVIASSHVVLVLIGPGWLGNSPSGLPRLFDPDDVVRLELEQALEHGKVVIPLLLYGATMPRADQLPPTLSPLSMLNAFTLGDRTWDTDVKALCLWLRRVVPVRYGGDATTSPPVASADPIADAETERHVQRRRPLPTDRRADVRRTLTRVSLLAAAAVLLLGALTVLVNLADEPSMAIGLEDLAIPPSDATETWNALKALGRVAAAPVAECSQPGGGCLSGALGRRDQLLPRSSALLQRYASLHEARRPAPDMTEPRVWAEEASMVPMLNYSRAAVHTLGWIAIDWAEGRHESAWRALIREAELHRRMLAGSPDGFFRLVSSRWLLAALHLADEAMLAHPPRGDANAALQEVLRPLDGQALDLMRFSHGDLKLGLLYVRAVRDAMEGKPDELARGVQAAWSSMQKSGEPPAVLPFGWSSWNWPLRPFYKHHATENHFWRLFALNLDLLNMSPDRYAIAEVQQRLVDERDRLLQRLGGAAALYNPIGKQALEHYAALMLRADGGLPDSGFLYTETYDLQAYLCLLSTKLALIQRRAVVAPGPGVVPVNGGCRNPYSTRTPMIDKNSGRLSDLMLGRRADSIAHVQTRP